MGNKQKALQQAVIVPWRRLEEAASVYVEWHLLILWMRTIAELELPLPAMVAAALDARCPGFLQDERQEERKHPQQQRFLWHSLEEWVVADQFTDAKTEGWFDALMYYAYKDLRTEQAWTLWERTTDMWRRRRPSRWPTVEEWTAQVIATESLTQAGTAEARAVEALSRVAPERLRRAVSEVLDQWAFALWVGCIAQPERELREPALSAIRSRYLRLLPKDSGQAVWTKSMFYRLVRTGDAKWRRLAHEEGWYPALRYHVIHHPRYHRLVHYNQRCGVEWARAHPMSYPCFSEWLRDADAYCVARPA